MRTTQAKVRDGITLSSLDNASALSCCQSLEVDQVKQGGLNELAINNGALYADHRLTWENKLSLWDCINGYIELVVAQKLKERWLKETTATRRVNACQVVNIVVFKDKVFN